MQILPMVPGMQLGVGCNPMTGEVYGKPFSDAELWTWPGAKGQDVELMLHLISNGQELSDKLKISATASFLPDMPFGATAEAKLLRQQTTNTQNIYFLVAVIVKIAPELMCECALTKDAKQIYKRDGYDAFKHSYGPGFVKGLIKGGAFYGLITIHTKNNEEKREIAGKLGGKALSFSTQAELDCALRDCAAGRETKITVFRSGGPARELSVTIDNMLDQAMEFPKSVETAPVAYFALYQEYLSMPPFSVESFQERRQHREFLKIVENLENKYLEFRDYNQGIADLLKDESKLRELQSIWRIESGEVQEMLGRDLHGTQKQLNSLLKIIETCNTTGDPCELPRDYYEIDEHLRAVLDDIIHLDSVEHGPGHQENPTGEQVLTNKGEDDALANYNVAIVGQTGVGKSSLINYLYGDKVAPTGTGEPVTMGFEPYRFNINELPVSLFDSKGLEVDDYEPWKVELNKELTKRGVDAPADEWFHSVFYCINSGSHRLQNVDKEIMTMFLKKDYMILILLTKADLSDEEQEQKLKAAIRKIVGDTIPIIAVCAEERSVRGRERSVKTERFGKTDIEVQVYDNFWESIALRLPARCKALVLGHVSQWRVKQLDWIERMDSCGEPVTNMVDRMEESLKTLKQDFCERDGYLVEMISGEIRKTLTLYGQITSAMQYDALSMELAQDFEAANVSRLPIAMGATTFVFVLGAQMLGPATAAILTGSFLFPVALIGGGVAGFVYLKKKARKEAVNVLRDKVEGGKRVRLDDRERKSARREGPESAA